LPSAPSTSDIFDKKKNEKNRKLKMINRYKQLHTEYVDDDNEYAKSFANFAYINEDITEWCINININLPCIT
jgi:hypothetical protein